MSCHEARTAIAVVALGLMPCMSAVRAEQSFQLYLQAQSFSWKEYDDTDKQVVEESGPVFGLGYKLLPDPLFFSFIGRLAGFWGEVDYDGQRWNGEPVKDKTEYIGYLAEPGLSVPVYKAPQEDQSLLLFGGLGVKTWYRFLGQDDDQGGGYTEHWFNFYARLGAGYHFINNKKTTSYISAGLKLPLQTDNFVDFDSDTIPDADLEPEGKPAPFVEAGIQHNNFFAAVFYEFMRFERSDTDTAYLRTYSFPSYIRIDVRQPTSEMQVFGVNLGVMF